MMGFLPNVEKRVRSGLEVEHEEDCIPPKRYRHADLFTDLEASAFFAGNQVSMWDGEWDLGPPLEDYLIETIEPVSNQPERIPVPEVCPADICGISETPNISTASDSPKALEKSETPVVNEEKDFLIADDEPEPAVVNEEPTTLVMNEEPATPVVNEEPRVRILQEEEAPVACAETVFEGRLSTDVLPETIELCARDLGVEPHVAAQRIFDALGQRARFSKSGDESTCPGVFVMKHLLSSVPQTLQPLCCLWTSAWQDEPVGLGRVQVEYLGYGATRCAVPTDTYVRTLLAARRQGMRVQGCPPLEALCGRPRTPPEGETAFGDVPLFVRIKDGVDVPKGAVAYAFVAEWPERVHQWIAETFARTHSALRPAVEMTRVSNQIVWVGPRAEILKAQVILLGLSAQKITRWQARRCSDKKAACLMLDTAGLGAAVCELALRRSNRPLFVLGVWLALAPYIRSAPRLGVAVDLDAAYQEMRGCATAREVVESSMWVFQGVHEKCIYVQTRQHAEHSVYMSSRFSFAAMGHLLDLNPAFCKNDACACRHRGAVPFDEKDINEVFFLEGMRMDQRLPYICIFDHRHQNKKVE